MTITDTERIARILKQYEKKREKEKERYQLIKDTEDFKTKNRQRARDHYEKNKDKKREKYENNKEYLNARSQYYYYKKTDRLDIFKEKYPNKIELLQSKNMII